MHTTLISELSVSSLNQDQHRKTCGYWYLLQMGIYPHTAFATERGLLRWLQERGLDLTDPLPPRGTWSRQAVSGEYKQISLMDAAAFEQLTHKKHSKIKLLDNGEYTMGLVVDNDDGSKSVYHLNCNVRTRVVYDYVKTKSELDGESALPIDAFCEEDGDSLPVPK